MSQYVVFFSYNISCVWSKETSHWNGSFEYPQNMFCVSNKQHVGCFAWLLTLNTASVLVSGAFCIIHQGDREHSVWTLLATACSLPCVVKTTMQCKLSRFSEAKRLLIYILHCCLYCLPSSCLYCSWCILVGFVAYWNFEINLSICESVHPSVCPSIRPLQASKNLHNSWTTRYIFIIFCIHMHVYIP